MQPAGGPGLQALTLPWWMMTRDAAGKAVPCCSSIVCFTAEIWLRRVHLVSSRDHLQMCPRVHTLSLPAGRQMMLTLVLPSTSREKLAPVTVLKVTFILPLL